MIGESLSDAERRLFIPHAPNNLELAERMAWRAGYRAAIKFLAGSATVKWCEVHRHVVGDISDERGLYCEVTDAVVVEAVQEQVATGLRAIQSPLRDKD